MRILLVDEHPIVAYALRNLLKNALPGDKTIDTTTDSQMLEYLEERHHDILVLAISVPGSSHQLALLTAARQQFPDLGIIAFSSHDSPCLALASLELGADAYICKQSEPALIIDAILAFKAGITFCDPAINLSEAFVHPWHTLSKVEREVFLPLACGSSLEALAKRKGRSYKTIATHKYNALKKLGLRSNETLREYLVSQGLDYLIGS